MRVAFAIVMGLWLAVAPVRAAEKPDVAKLAGVLQSASASELEKDEACRALARVGTADAVPALAGLLGDEHLCTLARGALEAIPDPAAGAALREALGKLQGRPLVGAIVSAGNRRDREAIPALVKLMGAAEDETAAAAAGALAEIGGADAAETLTKALAEAKAGRKAALADACLRCAQGLAEEGKKQEALGVYAKVSGAEVPAYVVRSATLSAIRLRGEEAVPQITGDLKSEDWAKVLLGLQASRLVGGPAMAKGLLNALEGAPAEKQALIVKALADREDKALLGDLLACAGKGEPAVRVEALRAVGRLADAKAAAELFALAGDPQAEVAAAAQEVLAGLPGKEVDEAIMAKMGAEDPKVRLMALEIAGKRQIKTAGAALLKMADDPDRKVRLTALKALGESGGPAELEALLARLMKSESGELTATENALRSLAVQLGQSEATTDKLLAALPQAGVEQRCAALRLVGALGAPAGLKAVQAAANAPEAQVKEAAFRALCDWPSGKVAADLLQIVKTEQGPRQILALRGYIRLIGAQDVAGGEKIKMCRQAAALAKGGEEKKLLLGQMQTMNNPQVLVMVLENIDNPEVRTEAGLAAVTIAEKLTAGRTLPEGNTLKLIRDGVQKVAQSAENDEVKRRARVILTRIAAAQGKGKKK